MEPSTSVPYELDVLFLASLTLITIPLPASSTATVDTDSRDVVTGELCKPYTNPDRHGVRDMIDGECIEDVNDVIQASDGHCYRKSSLKEWYETSQRSGYIPKLPFREPFTNEDIGGRSIHSSINLEGRVKL